MKNAALKIVTYLKPYWLWIVLAPLLMLMEVVMDLMQPRMVQRIVDEGIARLDMSLVLQTGLIMFGLAVIGATGGMSNGIFAELTVQSFGADLRESLFRKVQSFSFRNLDAFETGQLITRLTNDVAQVQEGVLIILRMLVRAPLLLVGSLVMAIITSPQLAFLPLVLLPIELAAVIWIVNRATPLYTLVQERLDALNGVMEENLSGVRVVKAFARAHYERSRFGKANHNLAEQSVQAARTVAIMPSFMMLTMNLGIISVLWFGGIQVVQGGMQVGQIIAFVNYLMTTLFSLMMVSQMVIQFARAEASARRIVEVLETQPDVQDLPEARSEVTLKGQVEFKRVTFGYDGNQSEPVLKEISFSARPGEMVALLGMTGSGKTTLVNLIPRFYDVQAGQVTLDGMDVRAFNQKALRRNMGIVLQETVLFSGTIRDNIRYGRPDASDEEVIAAAKAAQAHDFILALPDGYDTVVGQRGVNLSGGQKQRIAIARALLMKPAVLILDDSTSAVDVETEVKIQDALDEIMRDRTCLIIAQRISTVLKADKILVLDSGQIVAQGTHRELMENSPIYREIYESQLGNGVKLYE
ncbi:MAG TPA: ABC transporter ATP-binding protein [Anaerolinea thermolimosa]|uniref:ABC transporter ATP-binding protein n=1 Tax=Anaerolinea thermolimosa TaxID=229919 RepID=A0A3D1JJU2_9CHLR|nr:ABC transporter ATP-binding protein [Anaerolinea thermolimosa]GAP07989.1 ABC-type multidrug transport system, ATPase and permease components [Anaerolinea thermolimosa]HCE18517.1 ABC transporter ATP-binding protein [Anaerolinea thermolimosa]